MGRRPGLPSRYHRGAVRWLCLLALFVGSLRAQATQNALLWPSAIAYDTAGNLYIADSGRHQVFEATLAGTLLVVAGSGTQGFAGDGGLATSAELNGPQGIAVAADGTLYIADTGNARIRAVSAGTIRTLAGTGQHAFTGDGGAPIEANFRTPAALALDGQGGLLVCDPTDHRIRRIGLQDGGLVSTVAGTGVQGYSGDGGAAAAAELDSPEGVVVASDGRVFIADSHNQRIRLMSAAGTISTYAGNGTGGYGGDGGPATAAQLTGPRGLALAGDGTLWIGDAGNRRVRQVSPGGVISTLAGSGIEGSGTDGDAPAATLFRTPRALADSFFNQLVVADALNSTVRVLTAGSTVFRPAALATGRAGSKVGATLPSTEVYGVLSTSVSVTGPVGTPQGTVTLSEAGSTLASAVLQEGSAALGGWIVAAGSHTLQATYGGDGLNGAASSNPLALVVTPLTITAVANSASATYGTTNPTLTGRLQGVLGADVSQVNAVFAVAAGTLAPVGTYPIIASLTGTRSGNYVVEMAADSGTLQITPAASATSLPAVAAGYAGLPLRFTANVASSTQGQPTGTVQFLDGANVVATGTLVNGSAAGVEVAPSPGIHNLVAVYAGDANFLPSTSALQSATVGVLPDFSLSFSGASSASALAGSNATYQMLVGASPAPFTGVVTLAVSGLPTGATATFSPVQVVPGTSAATVVLTVTTPAVQASLPPPRQPAVWFGCLGVIGLVNLRRRRRLSVGLSLIALCLLMGGCGARTVGDAAAGTSNQIYALTITGTSTNLLGGIVTHSTAATLTVQQ